MDREQERILDRRFREAARQQPDLKVLRRLLLGLGGTHLVAPPSPDGTLPLLINAGFVMAGPVVQRTMKKSDCHRNVAEIWAKRQDELVGIGTGYSLSDDGLWREHSWGVRREGILETTVSRVKYFGVLLQHGDADSFAVANLAGSVCFFRNRSAAKKALGDASGARQDLRRAAQLESVAQSGTTKAGQGQKQSSLRAGRVQLVDGSLVQVQLNRPE